MSELLSFQSSQEGARDQEQIAESKRVASPATLVIVESPPPRAKPGGEENEDEGRASKPSVPVSFDMEERVISPQMQVADELLLGELTLPPVITFGDLSLLTPADALLQRGMDGELPFSTSDELFDGGPVAPAGGGREAGTASPESVLSDPEGDAEMVESEDDVSLPPTSPSPLPGGSTEPEAFASAGTSVTAAIVDPLPELPGSPEFFRVPSSTGPPFPGPAAEVVLQAPQSRSPSPLVDDAVVAAQRGSRAGSGQDEARQPTPEPTAPGSRTTSPIPSFLASLPPIPSMPPPLPPVATTSTPSPSLPTPSPPPPPPPPPAQPPSRTLSRSRSPAEEPDTPTVRYTQQPPREGDADIIVVSRPPPPTTVPAMTTTGTQPRSRHHPDARTSRAGEGSLPPLAAREEPRPLPITVQRSNARPTRSMEVQPHQHPLAPQPSQSQALRARPPSIVQANENEPPPPSYDALHQTRPMPSASAQLRVSGQPAEPWEPASVRTARSSQPHGGGVPSSLAAQPRPSQPVRTSLSSQAVPTQQSYTQRIPSSTGFTPSVRESFGFAEEAPPDYNSLFGPSLSMSESSSSRPGVARVPVPREVAIPMTQLGAAAATRPAAVQPPSDGARRPGSRPPAQDRSCFGYAKRSPEKSGVYIGLFIIGVLVSLSMLAVGIIIFLTSSSEATQGIYLMVMGGASSFFVCWHSVALCTGVYIKSRNSDDKNYFILRVCNFGAIFLMIAAGVVSYLIWIDLEEILADFTVLQGIVIGFLIIMYIMTLYCCLECFFDTFAILRSSFQEQPSVPLPASYRPNPIT